MTDLDAPRRDAKRNRLKWCPACAGWRRIDCFSPNRGRYDGRASVCRRCMALYKRRQYANLSLTKSERKALERRDRYTDPADVDRFDRRQRRIELRHLGLPGVRELRHRLARVRELKASVCGRPLTDAEIDAATGGPTR